MEKTIRSIIIAMMFFAVVFRGPSLPGEVREWFVVYFEIALTMGLAAIIWQTNRWLASFLILTWAFMFFPMYGYASYLAGRAVFNGCLWYLFIVLFFDRDDIGALYRMMRILVYFHVSVSVLQLCGVAGWVSVPMPTGLMANPLELAGLVCFCFPAFLVLKNWQRLFCSVPFCGVVIAGQSLGYLSLWIGIVFFLAVQHRIYIPAIASVFAIIGIWLLREYLPFIFDERKGMELSVSIKNRLYVWDKAIRAWWQHPILGAGIGHWKLVFSKPMKIDNRLWLTTHNEFLQMLFELGVTSAVIFIGYAVSIIRNAARDMAIPLTAIVIIAVYSSASFTMHIAPTAIIAVTWLGVLNIYEHGLIRKL